MPPSAVTLDELTSETLLHRPGDLFAPPGLTNWLGTVAMDNDLVGIRNVTFPPFAHGDTITARAYIGGRLASSYGADVAFTWRPDRVVRQARLGDVDVTTTTVAVPDAMAVAIDIVLRNTGSADLEVPVVLRVAGNVTQALRPWAGALPPGELGSAVETDALGNRIVFRNASGDACSVQGVDRGAHVSSDGLALDATVPAGGEWRVGFVVAVGADRDEAAATFDTVVRDVPGALVAAEQRWQDEIDAMFTPGNDSFGGALPVLETSNEALRRLYYMGAVGVLYFRRDSPYSVLGRSYDTLLPRYWATVTFIWDYYLSLRVHALLDPGVMRRHIEHWIATDTKTHYGTEWLTGAPVGCWYSVNDLAMTRLITEYVKWTGDDAWLAQPVPGDASGRTVSEQVDRFATAWHELRQPHGLADYGCIDNLLECVSSYVHAVASFNAGNVWCLRAAAEMHQHRGELERAEELRAEAKALAAAVNDLYVEGEGYWQVRHPDGTLVPVKHAMDFFYVVSGMLDDLSATQRAEMTDFFAAELQTPTWMHALAPSDPDAVFSDRPDHQWNGAYPAWPAESASALFRMGRADIAAPWLQGLADSTNQGPLGQAHFAEPAVPRDGRGARKAPADFPWITDWTVSSSGSWVGLVIDAIFGVTVTYGGTVTASPNLELVDPGARLRNLVVAGVAYDIDAAGVHRAEAGDG